MLKEIAIRVYEAIKPKPDPDPKSVVEVLSMLRENNGRYHTYEGSGISTNRFVLQAAEMGLVDIFPVGGNGIDEVIVMRQDGRKTTYKGNFLQRLFRS